MRTRRLWLLIASASLVPAVLDGTQTYLQGLIADRGAPPWQAVLWSAAEWLILGALTPIVYWLARRFPLRRPGLPRSLAAHVGGALVLCVGWATTGAALRWVLDIAPPQLTRAQQLMSWLLTSLPWSVFMYFTVLGCVYAFSYFFEAQEREAQAARLAARLAEARLGALRMQLNPHFLFNSLNAITVLVRDQDTRAATRMLDLLSDVLRQVLRTDQAHEVSLAEELRFLKQYLAIEQVRFSDRLHATVEVDESLLDAAVPAFVLQPLVENALRHGVAKRSDAGRVEILGKRDADELVLSVRDDGAGLGAHAEPPTGDPGRPLGDELHHRGNGVGLANTRERLSTLYGDHARLTLRPHPTGGTIATVRVPYRTYVPPPARGADHAAHAVPQLRRVPSLDVPSPGG